MKLSRYNSYISLGEGGYSPFTDSFVAVKSLSDGFAKKLEAAISRIHIFRNCRSSLRRPVRLWRTILMKSTLPKTY